MALPLEDYAIIGDTQTAALVGRDGSIDWMCIPRFDAPACFAALLGDETHGRWRIAPSSPVARVERRYRPGTLLLETDFSVDEGAVRVIDFMPPREHAPDVVRIVEGLDGRVDIDLELVLRFDYGHLIPWVQRADDGIRAVAGPDAVRLRADVPTVGEDLTTRARFAVRAGERVAFVLTWFPSHEPDPRPVDPETALEDTVTWWRAWAGPAAPGGRWQAEVERSLITLKALTYAPTGGIVAAPTTSLPEQLGGRRNWDYRYVWLRDATLTLLAFLDAGHVDEAGAWRDWLLRAVAGHPADTQIMYGPAGERRLTELELDWLPGYEDSRPVRVGNAASDQFQLDVYGEVMDALLHAREAGLEPEPDAWQLQLALLSHVEEVWRAPDDGIWEMRSGRRHFVHSKVMAWVAFDRGVKTVERHGLGGRLEHWRRVRDEIHAEICEHGFDAARGTFTQSYGSEELDAAALLIPVLGFLPPDDPRVVGTVDAVLEDLYRDGFVLRYRTGDVGDGLPPGEGAFLPCSFWLVDALAMIGRREQAAQLFERLVGLANDVGLLSEEYDTGAARLVGNFPQAFTHVGLISSALLLDACAADPPDQRATSRRERRTPAVSG
jgi:GH15 family glucan-1,4-alpha-glucosidase